MNFGIKMVDATEHAICVVAVIYVITPQISRVYL